RPESTTARSDPAPMGPSFRRLAETLLCKATPAADKPCTPDLLAASACHPPTTRPLEATSNDAVSSSVVIATPTPYAPSAATLAPICAATRARRDKPPEARPVTWTPMASVPDASTLAPEATTALH